MWHSQYECQVDGAIMVKMRADTPEEQVIKAALIGRLQVQLRELGDSDLPIHLQM